MIATEAVQFTGQIAALQGAPGETIQTILSQFAEELKRDGFRVAGVVEVSRCSATGACKSLAVRDLTSETVIKFSQDLGTGSTACNLDPSGLAQACEAVERAAAYLRFRSLPQRGTAQRPANVQPPAGQNRFASSMDLPQIVSKNIRHEA